MARVEPLMTVDDLALLPDDGSRCELIEGELLVTGMLSITHQRVSRNLLGTLWPYFQQHAMGEVITAPGVILDTYNSVITDLIVMTNERRAHIERDDYLWGPPNIVIEIVSPGGENMRRDRIMKREVYGKFGVDEYWVVDPQTRTIEVYQPDEGTLALAVTLAQGDELSSAVLPGFVYAVDRIFKR